MRFKDVQCEYCKKIFTEDDDVVVCPQCGSPHHRDCWKEKSSCANDSRHEEGFVWEFPENLKPVIPQKKTEVASENTNYTFKNGESAVTCPHCGALNYGFDALCMQCKKPLYYDSTQHTADANNENSGEPLKGEALYEHFRKYGGLRPETVLNGHSAAENAEYIGKNSGRFIRKFAIIERFNRKFAVSLCAFIFGPIWFFYRKLFKEGLLFLLAMLLITSAQTYCSLTEPMKVYLKNCAEAVREFYSEDGEKKEFSEEDLQKALNRIDGYYEDYNKSEFTDIDKTKYACSVVLSYMNLSISIVMALTADIIYKKKIRKDIENIKKQHSTEVEYKNALKVKGGVSVPAAVFAVVATLATFYISIAPFFIAFADKL